MADRGPGGSVRGMSADEASSLDSLLPDAGALPPRLAERVRREAVPVVRAAGSVLFDEGSVCGGMLVLGAGAIRVSRVAREGRELMLYRVRPGESCVLTTSCLLERSTYPARGVAESDVRGLLLPAELFDALLQEAPGFRRFVFGSFVQRISGLLELAASVSFERLDRRLAAALLARVETSGRIELHVTHHELAQELGTVRERVSRLLEGFESGGWVDLGRGRILVRDKAALAAAARD